MNYFLGDIVTLRDVDWDVIKDYFIIPNNAKMIDSCKIQLKDYIKLLPEPLNNNTLFFME